MAAKMSAFALCLVLLSSALPEPVYAQSWVQRAGDIIAKPFKALRTEEKAQEPEQEIAADTEQPNTPCRHFSKIKVSGYRLFSADAIDRIIAPYEDICIDKIKLVSLLRDLEQAYSDKGYKSVRTHIPKQDRHKDILNIVITEDHVESVNYVLPDGKESRHELYFLRHWLEGRSPLSVYDLDHVIARMGRLPSNNVTVEFGAGDTAGGVDIDIMNTPTKRWHAGFGINNYGLASTGELQATSHFSLDNPFGFNDRMALHFTRGLNDEDNEDSRHVSFSYEFPTALWLFSYRLNYFDYISHVDTPTQSFKTDGFSRSHIFGANYALHRDAKTTSHLHFGLEAKENQNFISGFRLENSSQKQTIASIGLQHTRRYDQGSFFIGATLSRGLTSFGAREDQNLTPDDPHAQFNRLGLNIQHAHHFLTWARDDAFMPSGGKAYPRLNITAQGQWADKTLFGSEQMNIGGPFSVRGFKDTAIGGEKGGFIRTEFSYPLPAFPGLWANKMLGQLRPFIGFDAGGIVPDDQNPFERGGLTSATFGLGNDYGYFDLNASLSKTLSAPSFIDEEAYEAYFSLNVNF